MQDQFLSTENGGGFNGHIKNLYLRDHKKKNILLIAEQDRQIDLKTLHLKLGTGRLSFGSADRLMEYLGVPDSQGPIRPGAVTPASELGRNSCLVFS